MANLTSEQEELLKEIKSTFGGESEQEEKKEQVENEENPAEESLTEENAFKESTAEAKEAEEEVPLDPMSDKTTDVLKDASKSKKDTLEEDFVTAVKISNNKAMPKYGPGFKYVPIISGITLVAVILGHLGPLAGGVPANKYLRYIYVGIGVLILAWGVSLILNAINECAILLNAQMGKQCKAISCRFCISSTYSCNCSSCCSSISSIFSINNISILELTTICIK